MDATIEWVVGAYALAALTTFIWLLVRLVRGDFRQQP